MANGRDHSFVALARLFDENLIAMLDAFFDYAAPANTMISQLAIPLVIVVSDFALLDRLLRKLRLRPGLSAGEFIRFALAIGIIPGIEKLTGIAPLWVPIGR